jgi:uncharacterized lipoprotein YmbA
MNKIRTAGWMVGFAVAVTLGACQSAPTRIYSLDPAVPATRVDAYQAPALRVDTVNVPASWDRIEILRPSAAGRLEISDFDHWSAPLAQIVRQTLSEDLDRRLPSGSVIYPRLPKTNSALGISVDILEFTVVASQASMRASWLIVPAVGSQSAKRSVTSLQGPITSTEPAAVAHAWSELIGQLADRIAADAASFQVP